MLDGMPPKPQTILVLCCMRTSTWDVIVHAREMERSPNHTFQVSARGSRAPTGWEGSGGVTLAGAPSCMLTWWQRVHAPRMLRRQSVQLPGCTQALPDAGAFQSDTAVKPPCNANNYFVAPPPTSNHDSTNSCIYCLILLHAAGLLRADASRRWCSEVLRLEPFRRVLDLAYVACCPCSAVTGTSQISTLDARWF